MDKLLNTCKDCVFWTRRKLYKSTHLRQLDYGTIQEPYTLEYDNDHKPTADKYTISLDIIEHDSKFGECSCPKIIYDADDMRNENTPDAFLYEDSEQYNAWHRTGQDFGCIHFERKE